jgi:hypothetical protein
MARSSPISTSALSSHTYKQKFVQHSQRSISGTDGLLPDEDQPFSGGRPSLSAELAINRRVLLERKFKHAEGGRLLMRKMLLFRRLRWSRSLLVFTKDGGNLLQDLGYAWIEVSQVH